MFLVRMGPLVVVQLKLLDQASDDSVTAGFGNQHLQRRIANMSNNLVPPPLRARALVERKQGPRTSTSYRGNVLGLAV